MTIIARVLLFICTLAAASCSHSYVAKDSRQIDPTPAFSSHGTVTLVNVQTSTQPFKVMQNGVHSFHGNLKQCTDAAILVAGRALAEHGMQNAPGASKQLRMSITAMHTHVGMVQFKSQVSLEVQTGGGYSKTFVGLNNSAMATIPRRHFDGTIMRAVVAMLSDPNIISYLTK